MRINIFISPPSHWSSRGTIWWLRPYTRDQPKNNFFVSAFFQFIRFPFLNVTLQLKTTFWPGFTVMLDITASSILGGPHVLTEMDSIWVTNERLRNCGQNLFCGNMFDMICGTFYEQTLFPQLAKFLVTFILCYGMAHEAIQKNYFVYKDPLNT